MPDLKESAALLAALSEDEFHELMQAVLAKLRENHLAFEREEKGDI